MNSSLWSTTFASNAEINSESLLILDFRTAVNPEISAKCINLQPMVDASLSKAYMQVHDQSECSFDAAAENGQTHSPGHSSTSAIQLNSGYSIPVVGLGTWKAAPGVVAKAVRWALEAGYRHIDCASIYENEGEVGCALAQAFKDGIVRRADVFITSKLW